MINDINLLKKKGKLVIFLILNIKIKKKKKNKP